MVEHLLLDFGSGHDLRVVRSSPTLGSVLGGTCLDFSLPLPLPLMLSKRKKKKSFDSHLGSLNLENSSKCNIKTYDKHKLISTQVFEKYLMDKFIFHIKYIKMS